MQVNRSFVKSGMCDTFELMAIAAYSDKSLTQELHSLQGTTMPYGVDLGGEQKEDIDIYEDEEHCQFITRQVEQLNSLCEFIRGNPYKQDGSLKLFEDYK